MGEDNVFSTGCETIDPLLGGGFKRGQIVQAYGESGAGKTNLAAVTAVNTAVDGHTVFVLSKDPTTFDRITDIADTRSEDTDRILNNIWFGGVEDFAEQNELVDDLEEYSDSIDLIIFDGFGGHYRTERAKQDVDGTDIERRLARQVTLLKAIARRHNIAVFLTNQVYYSPDEERIKPLGGAGLDNWFDAIIHIESFGNNRHLVVVEKHRDVDEEAQGWFGIRDDKLVPHNP